MHKHFWIYTADDSSYDASKKEVHTWIISFDCLKPILSLEVEKETHRKIDIFIEDTCHFSVII